MAFTATTAALATTVTGNLTALLIARAGQAGDKDGTFADGSFTGGGGAGATFTYTVYRGALTSVALTAAGSGYTSTPAPVFPSVKFHVPPVLAISRLQQVAGTGYNPPDTVTVAGGSVPAAGATVQLSFGVVALGVLTTGAGGTDGTYTDGVYTDGTYGGQEFFGYTVHGGRLVAINFVQRGPGNLQPGGPATAHFPAAHFPAGTAPTLAAVARWSATVLTGGRYDAAPITPLAVTGFEGAGMQIVLGGWKKILGDCDCRCCPGCLCGCATGLYGADGKGYRDLAAAGGFLDTLTFTLSGAGFWDPSPLTFHLSPTPVFVDGQRVSLAQQPAGRSVIFFLNDWVGTYPALTLAGLTAHPLADLVNIFGLGISITGRLTVVVTGCAPYGLTVQVVFEQFVLGGFAFGDPNFGPIPPPFRWTIPLTVFSCSPFLAVGVSNPTVELSPNRLATYPATLPAPYSLALRIQ